MGDGDFVAGLSSGHDSGGDDVLSPSGFVGKSIENIDRSVLETINPSCVLE